MNILLEKNKPLLIYGNPGSGKTHLALALLKDTVLLRIDSSLLKGINDMNKYINDRVKKRNITLMFQEKNECRGLLIDDIHIFQKYDKKSFNHIIDFLKKGRFYNNNIIITCDTSFIKNKFIIRCKLTSIKCHYSYNEYYKSCLRMINDKKLKLSLDELDMKIYQSNYNFNRLLSDCDEKDSSVRDNFDGIEELTNKLCRNKYNINDIFRECMGDEKIILLNMIENIQGNFLKIYEFIDLFNNSDIFIKDYQLLNIPIYMINKNIDYEKGNKKIIYNRYVSKNMVTHKNNKVIDDYLLYLIDTYVKHSKYRDNLMLYDKDILEYHKNIYENIYKVKVSFP
jgi:adenylate kinase family enzyme